MPNKIILKKSSVASKVPTTTDLDYGELAINYADGKLYYKKSDGTTIDAFNAGADVTLNGVQTLNNKTASALVLNDGYTEEVFAITGTTPTLSPTNGSIQTWTLSGNSTPTAGNWASGQSLTLMIDDGTAYTITWSSLPVVWIGGTAPTLATTGSTVIILWKVGTTIYGTLTGQVA